MVHNVHIRNPLLQGPTLNFALHKKYGAQYMDSEKRSKEEGYWRSKFKVKGSA